MSIAEKLTTIAENEQKVYDAGKEAEQRTFWETFQNGGKRTAWHYVFSSGYGFNDETYNPIYPIKMTSGACTNTFFSSAITNTKVPINISGATLVNTFRYANIVTIPELIVSETTDISNGFSANSVLVNVKITGIIGRNWNMATCPLSVESLKSIIFCLKNYAGTENEYTYTVTFKSTAFETLEEEGATAEYNGVACTWAELIDNKKWNLVKA